MEPITIDPTSKDSAVCGPIILRQTESVRLVFKPLLVNSIHDKRHAVKGVFVYQRKKKADEWEDISTLPLSKLKGGEGVQLEVKSEEVYKLVTTITAFYDAHCKSGIPKSKMVAVLPGDRDAHALTTDKLERFGTALQKIGVDDLASILDWAVESPNTKVVVEQLERLDVDSLQKLNTLVGVSSLKNALSLWATNKENAEEEFWQQRLEQNAFVLSQVFSHPIVIVKGKAYVGGKGVENTGGNVLDYLCANELTRNVLLIEIKTPNTPLLGPLYRGDVFNVSTELSGAVMQVTNSKDSLLKSCHALKAVSAAKFDAFDPPSLVIAGNTQELAGDTRRVKSFELFRNGLKDVTVVTYDELFAKVATLVTLLEGSD
jgi:hypothetical protein